MIETAEVIAFVVAAETEVDAMATAVVATEVMRASVDASVSVDAMAKVVEAVTSTVL